MTLMGVEEERVHEAAGRHGKHDTLNQKLPVRLKAACTEPLTRHEGNEECHPWNTELNPDHEIFIMGIV